MLEKRLEGYQLLLDGIVAVIALQLSYLLRTTLPIGVPLGPGMLAAPEVLPIIIALVWLTIFYQNDVHVRKTGVRWYTRILNLTRSHVIASFLYFGILYMTYRDVSRLQSLYFVAVFYVGMLATRAVLRIGESMIGDADSRITRVLIVGTGENAARLRERIQSNPYNNLNVAGFVRLFDEDDIAPGIESEILGRAHQLVGFVKQGHIDEVVIAINRFSEQTAHDISAMLYELQQFPVAVRLAPDYSEISFFRVVADNFEGMPLIGLRTPVFSPAQRLVKRGMDLLISLTIIVLGFPLFAGIALAIKLDSKGPIIFRQQRIGIHGRPFSMYKFRSMYDNIKQAQFDETKLDIMKRPDDPRVTRIGRFLRRSSLDELPQLFNVLKGEMSLVGPRPEMPARVQEYVWWQFKRFEVPQGMTGWWQVNGRANRPMHMNTEDDLYYIENYSLWMDLIILWRTIRVVFTGEGAF